MTELTEQRLANFEWFAKADCQLSPEQTLELCAEIRQLRAAVEQEREACCRDVCPDCAAGLNVCKDPAGEFWYHVGDNHCWASAIRQRGMQC